MPIKALFFDAGNTLVFADTDRTLAPLAAIGLKPTQQQLFAAERAAKRRLDAARAARASGSTEHSPGKRAQRTAAAAFSRTP